MSAAGVPGSAEPGKGGRREEIRKHPWPRSPPRPKPRAPVFQTKVTSLNVTASIPAGELPRIPARIPRFSETFPLGKRG